MMFASLIISTANISIISPMISLGLVLDASLSALQYAEESWGFSWIRNHVSVIVMPYKPFQFMQDPNVFLSFCQRNIETNHGNFLRNRCLPSLTRNTARWLWNEMSSSSRSNLVPECPNHREYGNQFPLMEQCFLCKLRLKWFLPLRHWSTW